MNHTKAYQSVFLHFCCLSLDSVLITPLKYLKKWPIFKSLDIQTFSHFKILQDYVVLFWKSLRLFSSKPVGPMFLFGQIPHGLR